MQHRLQLLANFLGQFWVTIVGFAVVPVYLRYMGPEAYGVVGFAATMQACIAILDFGMTPAIGREMSAVVAKSKSTLEGRCIFNSIEAVIGAFVLAAAVLVAVLSPWIASNWLKLDALGLIEVAGAVAIIGVTVSLRMLLAMYRGALLGLQDVIPYNFAVSIFATLRNGGAAFFVAFISPSLTGFACVQLAVTSVEAVYFAMRIRLLLPTGGAPAPYDMQALKKLGNFAFGVSVTSLMAICLTQLDKLMLSTLLPLDSFSNYFLAGSLAGALTMLVGPISVTVYPRLAAGVASGRRGESLYHSSCQMVAVLVFPATFVLCRYSEALLVWWTRNPTIAAQAAPILEFLAIGTCLNALMQVPYMLQLANGWVRLGAIANSVACLLLVPLVLVAVPRFGPLGAAMTWVALNLGYALFAIPVMHRKLLRGHALRWYVEDNLAPALAAGGSVFVLACIFPVAADGSFLSIATITIVAITGVLSAMLATSRGRSFLWCLLGVSQ